MSEPHTNHILGAYMRASSNDREAGMDWYASARMLAETLMPHSVETAAGVIAALSPMTAWPENVKRATDAIMGEHVAHTEDNAVKVLRILSGESPLDVLSGPKTRAFYMNIMNIDSMETVTVDRHAIDIACGIVQSDTDRAKVIRGKAGYAKVAAMYVEAASIIGISPSQLQAVVWVWWRRTTAQNKYGDVK